MELTLEADMHAYATDFGHLLHGGRRSQADLPKNRCFAMLVLQSTRHIHLDHFYSSSSAKACTGTISVAPEICHGIGAPLLSVVSGSTCRRSPAGVPTGPRTAGSRDWRKTRLARTDRKGNRWWTRSRLAQASVAGTAATSSCCSQHKSAIAPPMCTLATLISAADAVYWFRRNARFNVRQAWRLEGRDHDRRSAYRARYPGLLLLVPPSLILNFHSSSRRRVPRVAFLHPKSRSSAVTR